MLHCSLSVGDIDRREPLGLSPEFVDEPLCDGLDKLWVCRLELVAVAGRRRAEAANHREPFGVSLVDRWRDELVPRMTMLQGERGPLFLAA